MSEKPREITGTLLTIGDEILLGDISNGNAHHIAKELRSKGFRLDRILTVGDSEEVIAEHLRDCLNKSSFLIVTGGLGPTDDDRTVAAVSKAFGLPLAVNRDYAQWLRRKLGGGHLSGDVERMADLPIGAVKLGMDMAGFLLMQENFPCYFLPGVPEETRYLLGRVVIPDLEYRFPHRCAYIKHVVRIQGLLEAEVNQRLRACDFRGMGVDIGYLPHGRENWVTIFASAASEAECRDMVKRAEEKVTALIGAQNISGYDNDCLERVIGRHLRERGWKLALAESCTGGLVSRKIAAIPGASDYLDRACVTYSNEAKMELLGVPAELLKAHGAVSEPVALAMVEGVRTREGERDIDVAVSITGIAGPAGGSAEKPVGTVYIACATPEKRQVERYQFGGEREEIQEYAAQAALVLLWKLLGDSSALHCD